MTALKKRVKRTVETPRYKLVVMLEPSADGGIVSVKESGRRSWYAIPVASLYGMLVKRDVEAKLKSKPRRRARRSSFLRGV